MENPIIGAIYKHSKKGNLYYILAIGRHTETEESMVIYIPLYKSDFSNVMVRPAKMFAEIVEIEGKKVPRFVLVKEN